MKARVANLLLGVLAIVVISGCSGSDEQPSAEAQLTSCEASAQEVIDRFDEFLAPYASLSPEEFLAAPELEGLEDFQNDIGATVVRVATDPNDDCTERDLEAAVDTALTTYAGDGLLNQYLVGVVQQGLAAAPRNISVTPDDDLIALLPLLGPGSSISFSEGVFELDATVLVQSELTIVGAGRDATVLNSSAETAALAVLGAGELVINDMSIRHVGELPASVVIVIDAAFTASGVGLGGGVLDSEGGGGSGLVLSALGDLAPGVVAVTDSVIDGNAAAGIAVTGNFAPTVVNTVIESNVQCGICFFDAAAGQVQSSTFTENGVGLQTSGGAAPEIALNSFTNNLVAGILIENTSTAVVVDNTFEGVDIVGIDVQGTAEPILQRNTFGPHAVAISLRGESAASVSANKVTGGDVAILVGGSATPSVFENELGESGVAGLLHTEASTGDFVANTIRPDGGAGVVVEGTAAPRHSDSTIDGGLVGFVFTQDAAGRVTGTTLTGQEVGMEIGNNATPTIDDNDLIGSLEAGVILSGEADPIVRNNRFDEPVEIAIQASGPGSPTIEGNRVQGGDTAMLITGASRPMVRNNRFLDQNFGIGVSGTAMPTIEDNEIRNAAAGAMSFEAESGGEVRGNTIVEAGVVGVRVAGNAAPSLEANMLFALIRPGAAVDTDDAEGAVSGAGILYADNGGGSATLNEIFGFVIGIQVSDSAAPELISNRVDGAGVGGVGILYGIEGAGTARANLSINQQLGFQLSGTTSPMLIDNVVEAAQVAAFLIQGESTADLTGNTCTDTPAGIVVLEQATPALSDNPCPST